MVRAICHRGDHGSGTRHGFQRLYATAGAAPCPASDAVGGDRVSGHDAGASVPLATIATATGAATRATQRGNGGVPIAMPATILPHRAAMKRSSAPRAPATSQAMNDPQRPANCSGRREDLDLSPLTARPRPRTLDFTRNASISCTCNARRCGLAHAGRCSSDHGQRGGAGRPGDFIGHSRADGWTVSGTISCPGGHLWPPRPSRSQCWGADSGGSIVLRLERGGAPRSPGVRLRTGGGGEHSATTGPTGVRCAHMDLARARRACFGQPSHVARPSGTPTDGCSPRCRRRAWLEPQARGCA